MAEPGVTVAAPAELDMRSGPPFGREVERRLAEGGVSSVLLDFADTTFIDSSGMGVLIGVREACLQREVALALRALHPRVQRTLTTAGLLTIFDVVDGGTARGQ